MGVEYCLSETGPLGGNGTGLEESMLLVCFLERIMAMEIQGMVINSGAARLKKKKEREELVLFNILVALKQEIKNH